MRKPALIAVAVLAVVGISAGTTVATIYAAPDLLPRGSQGERGPRGPQGLQGIRGEAGQDGQDATSSATSSVDEPSSAPPAPTNEEKHYYYDGHDLGTVSQHKLYCDEVRARQADEGVNDQDALERVGCRGGGLIETPSQHNG